jgi:ATP-dependent protease ClpP protease subunit
MAKREPERQGPPEIAIVGDLTENEAAVTEKLLDVPPDGECVLYFDCPGGSAYCAISLLTIIAVRRLKATGIVTGECSSAALWPLAACHKRLVTPFSVLLFHPMKWQSEEHVQLKEAAEWARHFADLEESMDGLLARFFGISDEQLANWVRTGRYVSGTEFAEAGLAEMIDLEKLAPKR